MSSVVDLSGKSFGNLFVLKRAGSTHDGKALWSCKCVCGNEPTIQGKSIRNGNTKSCGCLRVEKTSKLNFKHGHSVGRKDTKKYRTWQGIIRKTLNTKCPEYKYYGGRGISVFKEWRSEYGGFAQFNLDVPDPPEGPFDLDRIDNNRGYEPDNVRWATRKENTRNRRNTVKVLFRGDLVPLSEISENYGISIQCLYYRVIVECWDIEKALITPIKKRNSPVVIRRGPIKSLTVWGDRVKERDRYSCKVCSSNENLRAHHIIPKRVNPGLSLVLQNGITLCEGCHSKTYWKELDFVEMFKCGTEDYNAR